jgi:hypothetical protein
MQLDADRKVYLDLLRQSIEHSRQTRPVRSLPEVTLTGRKKQDIHDR